MPKDSFIIYTSFYKPIASMTDEQLGRLFRTIFAYQSGEDVSPEADILIAFEFFKNQFEVDEKKYEKICEKRREAGKRGNNARWAQNSQTSQKVASVANAINDSQTSQKVASVADNDNDNDNENENENENDNEQAIIIKKQKQKQKNKNKKESEEEIFIKALNEWNQAIRKYESNIKPLSAISDERRDALRKIFKAYGFTAFVRFCDQAAKNAYLNGRTPERKKPADFDWCIQERRFVKIIEGSI